MNTLHKQTLWIITASIACISITIAKDDSVQGRLSGKFMKAIMEQPNPCDSGYADYDSCETPPNSAKKPLLDIYEYNSEETNVDKMFGEILTTEEKRSHSRAGCDCQLSTTLIDLGPTAFPRHIRNVTCDDHKRCYHSRGKGLHCHPIHYQVSVIKMRDYHPNPNDLADSHLVPQGLRCCWKAMNIPTVVGCVCGPHY